MKLKRVFSCLPWEQIISDYHAIQTGAFVAVFRTTSMKEGSVFARGNAYADNI